MTEQDQALPAGMIQIDVNLVLQGYKDICATQTDQIVMLSARNQTLDKSNSDLVAALQQAHAALLQAQVDQDALKSQIEALKNPEVESTPAN